MRSCPKCQRAVADGVRFCQGCGTAVPAEPVRSVPVKKAGSHKALAIALWASLAVNILLCAFLVSILLGAFGPSSQMEALEEQVEALESQVEQWDP